MSFGINPPCGYDAVEVNAYNAYLYSLNNAITELIHSSDEELANPSYVNYVLQHYGLGSVDTSTLDYIYHTVACAR